MFKGLFKDFAPRHLREFARMARNRRIEFDTDNGIARIGNLIEWKGIVHLRTPEGLLVPAPNTWTTEGLTHLLSVGVNGGAQVGTWYFAPYSANATPASTWTAANFNSNATEQTNYDEATRQAWDEATPAAGSVATTTDSAFTASAGGMTIWGAGLLSVSTKGATSGTLLAAAKASNSITYPEGAVANVGYTLTLTPV